MNARQLYPRILSKFVALPRFPLVLHAWWRWWCTGACDVLDDDRLTERPWPVLAGDARARVRPVPGREAATTMLFTFPLRLHRDAFGVVPMMGRRACV